MVRSLAEKMMVKPERRAYLYRAPEDVVPQLGLDPGDTSTSLNGLFIHAHIFVTSRSELEQQFPRVKAHLSPQAQLWVSWPKAGGLGTDLNLHEVVVIGYRFGMVESTCISVDDTWSALRFTFPQPGKTYNSSHAELNREDDHASTC